MKYFGKLISWFLFALLLLSINLFSQELEELQELKEEKKAPQKEIKKEEKKEAPKSQEQPKLEELKESNPAQERPRESSQGAEVGGIPADIIIGEDIRPLFKERYEYTFDAAFETVYLAITKAIEERGCMIAQKNITMDDKGLQKGNVKSDDCVFSIGDSSFKVLRKYSLIDDRVIEVNGEKKVIGKGIPNVRGGIWLNGRLKYNFRIQEKEDGKTFMSLKTELSAFEDFVTHEVLFWSSNGILETYMLNTIFKHLRQIKGM